MNKIIKERKKKINFILLFLLNSFIFLNSRQVDSEYMICSDYLIRLQEKNYLEINNFESFNQKFKKFEFEIIKLEACLKFPFLYIIGEESDNRGNKNRELYLYDIERDHLESFGSFNDLNEKRWSQSGEYTYLEKGTSFLLLKTENLRSYLKTKENKYVLAEITGHPLGDIWQAAWFDRYLIYVSGLGGGPECWGLYDFKYRKNYFIFCCNMAPHSEKFQCAKYSKYLSEIINKIMLSGKSKEIIQISNDFYSEALRILKRKK